MRPALAFKGPMSPYRIPAGQHGVEEAVQVAVQPLVGHSRLSKAVQVWLGWGKFKFFPPADHPSRPQAPSPPETVATAGGSWRVTVPL